MKWEPKSGNWHALMTDAFEIMLCERADGTWVFNCAKLNISFTLLTATSLPAAQREAVRNVTRHIRKLHTEAEMMFQKFGKAKSVKEETGK